MNTQNTLTDSLTIAVLAALKTAKPQLTINDSLTLALAESIEKALPKQTLSENVRAAFYKAVSEKGHLVDTNNSYLVHMQPSKSHSKAAENNGELIPAHDILLDLPCVPDTIFRLATRIVQLHSRVFPTGCDETLQMAHIGKESLTMVNGGDVAISSATKAPEKDYFTIIRHMGITIPWGIAVNLTFDNHAADSKAITIIIDKADRTRFESYLIPSKKKGAFRYAKIGLNVPIYDVVRSTVLDEELIDTIGFKYRFTKTEKYSAKVAATIKQHLTEYKAQYTKITDIYVAKAILQAVQQHDYKTLTLRQLSERTGYSTFGITHALKQLA